MAIIRLDKVAGQHLEAVKASKALKNGFMVALGDFNAEGNRTVAEPTDVTTNQIVLHATPEVVADVTKSGLKHFELEAGEVGRAYHLVKGDIITVTKDLISPEPSVKDIITPQNSSFLLGTKVENATVQFEVLQETTLGYDAEKAFVLQVI